jgi:hypothetical protein
LIVYALLSLGIAMIAAEMVPNSQGPGFLDTTRVADGALEQVGVAEAELTVAERVVVELEDPAEIVETVDASDDKVLLAVGIVVELAEMTLLELTEMMLLELTEIMLLDDAATMIELLKLDTTTDETASEGAICAAFEACNAVSTS